MNKLVDAEALLRMARKYEEFDEGGWSMPVKAVPVEAIEAAPAVDAVPVVHGQNVTPTHYSDMFVCSQCGFACEITKLVYEDEDHPEVGVPLAYEYDCKFCPNCGAKMDETGADNARRPHLSKV